ncbi:kelch domain-containing protein 1-like isoform X1 [Mytilus galloprovincialis]|uniref:kelch domain-containing protein 1-like isoform X1 n=1 Tax=Mytilus galloprovincialis TaxID=29158 RepID=UPI003F7B99FF
MSQISRTKCKEATPRCGHVAASYGQYMIVWGGYSIENNFQYYLAAKELWIYNTENKVWHCMKTDPQLCPFELSGACACCYGDSMYVFGGHNSFGNSNELYRLDLKTYTWHLLESDQSPSPRDKAVAWFYNQKFYCFSGFGPSMSGHMTDNGAYVEDSENTVFPRRGWNNQLCVYDTVNKEWTNPKCKGDVPLPRAASSAARIGSDVYLFGGRHKTTRMNDLHCLDLETLTCSGELRTEGCLPCGRSWHTLTAIPNNRLFLYGGFDQNNTPLSDGWILDTITLSWCHLDYLPSNQPRLWHTSTLSTAGEIIIFGGCCNNILDYSLENKISGEVLTIQLQPYSLLRLCLDDVYQRKSQTEDLWEELPQPLCLWLQDKNKLEQISTTYDMDSDSEGELGVNEPGLACSIS